MGKKVESSLKSVTHNTIGRSDDAKRKYVEAVLNAAKSGKAGNSSAFHKEVNKNMNEPKEAPKKEPKPKSEAPKEAPKKEPKPKQELTEKQKELAKKGKAANRKLVALSKKGLSTPAQKAAKEWLAKNTDRSRFSTNPAKLNSDQVEQELYHVNKFLNAITSTATGHQKVIDKRNATFEGKGFSKEDLDAVYDVLSGKAYKKMVKKIESDQIVQMLLNDKSDAKDLLMKNPDFENLTPDQKRIMNTYFNEYHDIYLFDDVPNKEPDNLDNVTVEEVVFKK